MKLENKVALITGSTRGIGRAIAQRFAAEGAKVVVVGTNQQKGDDCVTAIKAAGGEALFRRTNLFDDADVAGLVDDALASYGRIDILVNNAGTDDPLAIRGVEDVSMDMWDKVMNVNVRAPFYLCKLVIPHMEEQGGGVILNTASIASTGAARGPFVYTVSKHAMLGLTRELSLYHGARGVRVNAVLPGGVATDMIAGDMDESNPAVAKIRAMPAGRLAAPEEIANVMAFLASDDASYIHGTGVTVDGGFTLL